MFKKVHNNGRASTCKNFKTCKGKLLNPDDFWAWNRCLSTHSTSSAVKASKDGTGGSTRASLVTDESRYNSVQKEAKVTGEIPPSVLALGYWTMFQNCLGLYLSMAGSCAQKLRRAWWHVALYARKASLVSQWALPLARTQAR